MSGLKDNEWTNYLHGKSSTYNFSYLSNSTMPIMNDPQLNNYNRKIIIPSQNKNKNLPTLMPPIIRGGNTRRKKSKRSHKSLKK